MSITVSANSSQGQTAIQSEADIVEERRAAREAGSEAGFGLTDVTRSVTAASELARNAFKYAGAGVMRWHVLTGERPGLELEFMDQGPGIADINLAMQEGYSSSKGLGLGLPGVKRLMDEMVIQSAAGKGTTITIKKWRRT